MNFTHGCGLFGLDVRMRKFEGASCCSGEPGQSKSCDRLAVKTAVEIIDAPIAGAKVH